jgi:molybdenum cofactor biosynthesis protein B
MGTELHRAKAPGPVTVGVLSVSSTRSLENDASGHWIVQGARSQGHPVVAHQIVPDDAQAIRRALTHMLAVEAPQAVIVTGGTGISPKDVTIEALRPLFAKEMSAFGSIFAHLSYGEIGAAALISRATAGVIGRTLVFCLPGSLQACKLACETLIFPELGHLRLHAVES